MPKLSIKRQSEVAPQEAYSKVKSFLAEDQDLKKLDAGYSCTFDDSALTGKATGKMFKADLSVKGQGQGSEVEIVVDLPLALTLVKGQIEKILGKKLKDTLG